MLKQVTALERAYQLADSGEYRDMVEIKAALVAEGYDYRTIQTELYGPTLSTSIRQACNRARSGPISPLA